MLIKGLESVLLNNPNITIVLVVLTHYKVFKNLLLLFYYEFIGF